MNSNILIHQTEILENSPICSDHFSLVLKDKEQLSGATTPGQFVNIVIPERPDLTLRRPFSVARTNPEKSQLEIIYRVVGKGTQAMVDLQAGQELDVMGPLGNGWSFPDKPQSSLLIGGGCGVAPLWGLAEKLADIGGKTAAIIGFQNQQFVFGEDILKDTGAKVTVTTDDGSYGQKGFVAHHLEPLLDDIDRVYICGPTPMAKSVVPLIIDKGIWGEISLEEHMGCGFGVCLSCVANIRRDNQIHKKRICADGPVFPIREVVWEL